MGKLSDILNGNIGGFKDLWNNTQAAGEFVPVPRGEYVCHVTKGEAKEIGSKETPTYQIEFTVIDGEYAGRRLWHDCWLTDAAWPYSKRDLGKLGITTPERMEQPLPRGIRCKVQVVLRSDDDGIERNRVRSFEVTGIDAPEVDAFAPLPPPSVDPTGGVDTSFDVPF